LVQEPPVPPLELLPLPPRGPQSEQSVPSVHTSYSLPAPPSSHTPSSEYWQLSVQPPPVPPLELLVPPPDEEEVPVPVPHSHAARSMVSGQMMTRNISSRKLQPAPPTPPLLEPPGGTHWQVTVSTVPPAPSGGGMVHASRSSCVGLQLPPPLLDEDEVLVPPPVHTQVTLFQEPLLEMHC